MNDGILSILNKAEQLLKIANFKDYKFEAKYILEEIINIKISEYLFKFGNQISSSKRKLFFKKIQLRIDRNLPLAYLFKRKFFYKNYFSVNKNCLIPREDSECIIEKVKEIVNSNKIKKDKLNIIDICSGSGCLGISILQEYINKINVMYFLDISKKALYLSKKNLLNIIPKKEYNYEVKFLNKNILQDIKLNKKFDIILFNPPYIKTKDILKYDKQLKHEPILALDGGKDGLIFYKRLFFIIEFLLEDNGYLIIEIGFSQKEEIEKIIKNYKNIEYIFNKDYNNKFRILQIKKLNNN